MAAPRLEHYDAVVIGAGMSGLAAGIRIALAGKRVCILERHNAPGGLNGFYSIAGRKYDVGLHAMTNYVRPGVKGAPLVKLLRQLRIAREDFALCEQLGSRIAFPGESLRFTNDFAVLESEVARAFPRQIDGFRRLDAALQAFDETALNNAPRSARAVIAEYLSDPVLTDMLLLPLLYYGSSWEHDMDFSQFAVMWKSIYREGFARPAEGVRRIIRVLSEKYRSLGGERRMKCGVRTLEHAEGRVTRIHLDSGQTLTADHILSSAGLPETLHLCGNAAATDAPTAAPGQLAFAETITVLKEKPADAFGWRDTIVFFNDSERVAYEHARDHLDLRSGVICIPNNYAFPAAEGPSEGWLRITALASYDKWAALSGDAYREAKETGYTRLLAQALRFLPAIAPERLAGQTVATDMFTPLTVERFTGHQRGAIYGSPEKRRDGRTHLRNLYLCGTDQGFLGITGAMLSGISMANLHVLGGGQA